LNRRKTKLLLSFSRTSFLKRYLNNDLKTAKNSLRFLKELELCSFLERRLDTLLYRLGLVATLSEARHLISHKKIKINNFSNTSFSRLLRKGDVISFVPSIQSSMKNRLVDEIGCRDFYFNTFGCVETNIKTLKIIILTEKTKIPQQIQHYSFSLGWNSLLRC
jgi:ribosomal protein S4